MTIQAATAWKSNAELILAARDLGYIKDRVLDPTFGSGTFWKLWRPDDFLAHDLLPGLGSIDFTNMPHAPRTFDTVVFDPPYKLNGTPDPIVDERYGVHVVATMEQRHVLIKGGITECVRVLKPKGFLLVKCMDQVSSGQVRWQTRIFADHAESLGLRLVDSLLMLGGREQPKGRRQVHARRNYSTMLILKK